jgi:4-hydroxy-tetrahydrodipicolinate reductase
VISTVIVGATGRMGLSLLRLLPEFPTLRLSAALSSAGSRHLGQDAGAYAGLEACGVRISADLPAALRGAGLVIDFSNAMAAAANVRAAAEARVPMLLGTTGLAPEMHGLLQQAAARIPLLVAANTSLGVNLLLQLVERAAQALGTEFNIEILEAHHRHKLDAPSGTALALGSAAARGRGLSLEQTTAPQPRGSAGTRRPEEIGFAVLRGGDVVGEHEVRFLGNGERLTLAHSATDRAIFARGALQAGQWLAGQPPGRHQMQDIFLK